MSLVILLDAGPLGLITNPRASQETRDCNLWLRIAGFEGGTDKDP